LPSKKVDKKLKKKVEVDSIVERKSKDDPIFDERKVKNNAIDYRLPIDSSNLAYTCPKKGSDCAGLRLTGCGSSRIFLLPLPAPYKVSRFRVCFRFQLLSSKCFRFHKNLTAFTASASSFLACVYILLCAQSTCLKINSVSLYCLQQRPG